MSSTPDHYTVLGVTRVASESEVRKAYHRLALSHHPDKNPEGAEQFKRISEAWEVLRESESRREYDCKLESARWRTEAADASSRPVPRRPCPPSRFDHLFRESSPLFTAAGNEQQMNEDDETELQRRAEEDAERFRRREPLSGYSLRGRDKELFDEMLQRDAGMARRKESLGGGCDDFAAWRRRAEEAKAAALRDASQRAAEKERAADAARAADEANARRRSERIAEETRREWEAEQARLEEERAASQRRATAAADMAARNAAAAAAAERRASAEAAERSAEEIRRARRRTAADVVRLPGAAEITTLCNAELSELAALLSRSLDAIRAEEQRRQQNHTK